MTPQKFGKMLPKNSLAKPVPNFTKPDFPTPITERQLKQTA